jgi:hypothetical protein
VRALFERTLELVAAFALDSSVLDTGTDRKRYNMAHIANLVPTTH